MDQSTEGPGEYFVDLHRTLLNNGCACLHSLAEHNVEYVDSNFVE